MNNKTYQIDIKGDVLVLRTAFFEAGRGSILHSGIYNRELRASLAAGAAVLSAYFIFRPKPALIYFLLAIIQFAVFFIFFRMVVFYEPVLEAVLDMAGGNITVSVKKFISSKNSYPLAELKEITQGYVVITPENPDGVRIVEKIALQHGTVIPGFGEVKEFYTVGLELKNGKNITVFSSKRDADAKEVYDALNGFLIRGRNA